MKRLAPAALAALALWACYWQAMAGGAAYWANQPTVARLERASHLEPLNAAFWRDRGLLLLDADTKSAERMLLRAADLSGSDTDTLIALGLLAESSGRFAEAERYLNTASLSRRFKPKWALAYFYARHGRLDRFWPAASAAANVEDARAEPIFLLANQLASDPERVPDLLNLKSQRALASYVTFLLKQHGGAALGRVALRIAPTSETRPLLMASVDRLINLNQTDDAVRLWNQLDNSHLRKLEPATGASLTNGLFEGGEGTGFGWRLAKNEGIDLRAGSPGDLRIEFSGHQAESATILEQFVPVIPGQAYYLSFVYSTAGLNGSTGIFWQAFQAEEPLSPGSALFDPTPEGGGTLAFETGPGVKLVRIALRYVRSPGAMRTEGTVTLRSAKLEFL